MAAEPEREVEIQDPDNFTTSTRLQQIFEARRELRDIRREASQYRHSGGGKQTKMRAVQHYRSGVESYLLEVDTLLREHDPGPYLWSKKDYGTVTVQPPGNFTRRRGSYVSENIDMKDNVPLQVEEIPDPKHVHITGLKWLFETDSPVTKMFHFPIDNHEIGAVFSETNQACIGWTTLNAMVSDVNSFLGKLGIGLDVDDTEEWKI